MNVGSKLHEMVTSDGFTEGEWSDPAQIRQCLPIAAYTTREWLERNSLRVFAATVDAPQLCSTADFVGEDVNALAIAIGADGNVGLLEPR